MSGQNCNCHTRQVSVFTSQISLGGITYMQDACRADGLSPSGPMFLFISQSLVPSCCLSCTKVLTGTLVVNIGCSCLAYAIVLGSRASFVVSYLVCICRESIQCAIVPVRLFKSCLLIEGCPAVSLLCCLNCLANASAFFSTRILPDWLPALLHSGSTLKCCWKCGMASHPEAGYMLVTQRLPVVLLAPCIQHYPPIQVLCPLLLGCTQCG
mmetsp:Transcript_121384/g.210955  ORF Transcript_121384/g.210955 Transcript_121384/m.210955 type:complete len:211 (+) Transcript_121384:923-1555(+)